MVHHPDLKFPRITKPSSSAIKSLKRPQTDAQADPDLLRAGQSKQSPSEIRGGSDFALDHDYHPNVSQDRLLGKRQSLFELKRGFGQEEHLINPASMKEQGQRVQCDPKHSEDDWAASILNFQKGSLDQHEKYIGYSQNFELNSDIQKLVIPLFGKEQKLPEICLNKRETSLADLNSASIIDFDCEKNIEQDHELFQDAFFSWNPMQTEYPNLDEFDKLPDSPTPDITIPAQAQVSFETITQAVHEIRVNIDFDTQGKKEREESKTQTEMKLESADSYRDTEDESDVKLSKKINPGRKLKDPQMEAKLLRWIKNFDKKNQKIPGKDKIKCIALELSTCKEFKASKGWIDKFFRRNEEFFNLIRIKPSIAAERIIVREIDESSVNFKTILRSHRSRRHSVVLSSPQSSSKQSSFKMLPIAKEIVSFESKPLKKLKQQNK